MENNEKQHLELITEMINIARKEYSDDSTSFLLWGWSVCIASLAEFVLLKMGSEYHAAVWLILIPVALFQIVYFARQKKQERAKTHMDRVIGYVWISVGVSMGVVLSSSPVMQQSTYPVLILLYGIGAFISGGIMDLKAMKMGAICSWVIALVAVRVGFECQLLLLSLSLILSHIIPGHLLKNRYKQNV